MKNLTNKQIEDWLGSSDTLEEAIDVIKELANETYKITSLQQDIKEYQEEQNGR